MLAGCSVHAGGADATGPACRSVELGRQRLVPIEGDVERIRAAPARGKRLRPLIP